MFHPSSIRNNRSKSSNVKKALQVVVLLFVSCWLLYQVKHYLEKRTEYTVKDESKLSKEVEEVSLGRKGDAGSENVVIIDANAQGSDESNEINQGEAQHDASDINSGDKEISNALEDSHGSNLQNEKESEPGNHPDSHIHHDGEEHISLPSERKGDSSLDLDDDVKEEGRTLEENEHSNDVESTTNGEELTSGSTDQAESSENAGKESEELSGEASKQESSTDEEMQIGVGIESNAHDVLSEDEHVTSTVDNAAFTGSNVGDVTHTNGMVELEIDTAHEVEAKKLQNGKANNEESNEQEVNDGSGSASQVEKSDNESLGERKTDEGTKDDVEKSSGSDTHDDSEALSNDSVESGADKSSGTEGTINAHDELLSSSDANVDANGEPEIQRDSSAEAKLEVESRDKIEKSSEGSEHAASDGSQKDITALNAAETQETGAGKLYQDTNIGTSSESGNEIAEAGNSDKFDSDGNDKVASRDEGSTTSEALDEIHSYKLMNETSTGDNSKNEGSNDRKKDETKLEQSSNLEVESKNKNLNDFSTGDEATKQKEAK
ncbi:hypothetical protein HPP92_003624 [Vanilla planifolia]|uniref:Uncharacterized protein n=1 Tax=Vanilla planifolia TaxID=51239 RepID=A0A835SGT1_VANPL|nr:hypothetical protein HPP92_003624 [Vanilla planifolia]